MGEAGGAEFLPAGSSVRWQAAIKGNGESGYYANYGQLSAPMMADLAEGALWQAIYSAQDIKVQASDGWLTDMLYVDLITGIDWNTADLRAVIESAISQVFWFDPASVFYQVTYVPLPQSGGTVTNPNNRARAGKVLQTYDNGPQGNQPDGGAQRNGNGVTCPKGQHYSDSKQKCVDDCKWYDAACWLDLDPLTLGMSGAALGALLVLGAIVLIKK